VATIAAENLTPSATARLSKILMANNDSTKLDEIANWADDYM
jgi:hypothetical protein